MTEAETAAYLCSAPAIRDRCTALLAIAETTGLAHFTVDAARLPATAAYVAATIRRNYPALNIPHHARWRHFAVGGIDRWAALQAKIRPADVARRRVEVCILSVLLDAGAGPAWRYHDVSTGQILSRSEGLAVASLNAFQAGLFSSDGAARADAAALSCLESDALAIAFQSAPDNPLTGLEGRAALLRRLGAQIEARPDIFKEGLGGLFDAVLATGTPVQAAAVLSLLLDGLGPIWPGRPTLGGRPLGDTWPHPAIPGDGLVPFHKLSQWLAYSLLEVFEDAGHEVANVGALTGLPEYRNGGLLIDLGVLTPRHPTLATEPLMPGDEPVVEWRALTVALLDRLAPLIRANLGRDEAALPLSRLLEGGTWSAGRAIAVERRQGGPPPLTIKSDGTVF